jgi:large subunit ribosomal protein L4
MSPASDETTPESTPGTDEQPEATPQAEAAHAEATQGTADAGEAKAEAKAAAPKKAPAKAGTAKADTAKAEAEAGQPEGAKTSARKPAAKAADAGQPAAKAPAGKTQAARKPAAKPAASKAKAKAEVPNRLVAADLPADIFDTMVNVPLIHQVVVAQQAAARQGTHATKTRGDVRGGGRKPYRQKGTGRARQGSIRAPQFTGGGVVHGPVPRSYEQKTPKKMKAAALRGALSDRARHGLVQVVDGFVDGSEPKTRDALAVLTVVAGAVVAAKSVLVVVESSDKVTWKSLRNAPGVHLIDPGQLNTYDVLVSERVVFTASALESFVARAGGVGKGEDGKR